MPRFALSDSAEVASRLDALVPREVRELEADGLGSVLLNARNYSGEILSAYLGVNGLTTAQFGQFWKDRLGHTPTNLYTREQYPQLAPSQRATLVLSDLALGSRQLNIPAEALGRAVPPILTVGDLQGLTRETMRERLAAGEVTDAVISRSIGVNLDNLLAVAGVELTDVGALVYLEGEPLEDPEETILADIRQLDPEQRLSVELKDLAGSDGELVAVVNKLASAEPTVQTIGDLAGTPVVELAGCLDNGELSNLTKLLWLGGARLQPDTGRLIFNYLNLDDAEGEIVYPKRPVVDIETPSLEQIVTRFKEAPETASPNLKFFAERAAERAEAVVLGRDDWRNSQRRTLMKLAEFLATHEGEVKPLDSILPPGAGKTWLMLAFYELFGVDGCIFAPRTHLINRIANDAITEFDVARQTIGTFGKVAPLATMTYLENAHPRKQRENYLDDLGDRRVLLCDESQASLGPETQRVFGEMRERASGETLQFGFTATPQLRFKNTASYYPLTLTTEHYSTVCAEGDIAQFIVLPVRARIKHSEIGYQKNLSTAAEKRILHRENVYWRSLDELEKLHYLAPERISPVAFCADIEECRKFAQMADVRGYRCEIVTGHTVGKDRSGNAMAAIAKDFRQGKIDMLISINKILLGLHLGFVNAVLRLRACMSPSIVYQEAGRASGGGDFAYVIEPWYHRVSYIPREQGANKAQGAGSRKSNGKGGSTGRSSRKERPIVSRAPLSVMEALVDLGDPHSSEVCVGLDGAPYKLDELPKLQENGTVMMGDILGVGVRRFCVTRGYSFSLMYDQIDTADLPVIGYAISDGNPCAIYAHADIMKLPCINRWENCPTIGHGYNSLIRRPAPKGSDRDTELCSSKTVMHRMFQGTFGETFMSNTEFRRIVDAAIEAGRLTVYGDAQSQTHTTPLLSVREVLFLPEILRATLRHRINEKTKRVTIEGRVGLSQNQAIEQLRIPRSTALVEFPKSIESGQLRPLGIAYGPKGNGKKFPVFAIDDIEALPWVKDAKARKQARGAVL